MYLSPASSATLWPSTPMGAVKFVAASAVLWALVAALMFILGVDTFPRLLVFSECVGLTMVACAVLLRSQQRFERLAAGPRWLLTGAIAIPTGYLLGHQIAFGHVERARGVAHRLGEDAVGRARNARGASGRRSRSDSMAAEWKRLQVQHGFARLDAYEWQLHTHGSANAKVKLDANLDPAAGALVKSLAYAMRDAGFQLMCFLSAMPQMPVVTDVNSFLWALNTSFAGPKTAKGQAVAQLIAESSR